MNNKLLKNMKEDKVMKYSLCVVVFLLAIWHLWSLQYSPVVWYDEIVMAGINHSIIDGRGFIDEVQGEGPAYAYGPIYFLMTVLSSKILGFGLYSLRLVNLLFAFICVFATYKIIKRLNITNLIAVVVIAILAMDALLIQDAHSGRMECVALTFALICYYLVVGEVSNSVKIKTVVIFSISMALSFMTTPRVAVILLPIAIYYLWRLYSSHKWLGIVTYILIPILLYSIWVYSSYGSYSEMINYYTVSHSNQTSSSLVDLFVGGNFMIAKYHIPMIILSVVAFLYSLKRDDRYLSLLFLCPIVVFYLIVKDTGDYATFILPFYVILIALGMEVVYNSRNSKIKPIIYSLIGVCLFVNIGIFLLKAATVVSTLSTREWKPVDAWVAKVLKQGESVTGSDAYYYSLAKNGNSYQRPYYIEIDNEVKCITGRFRPKYLLLTDEDKEPYTKSVIPQLKLTKIAEYKPVKNKNFVTDFLDKHHIVVRSSYAGTLYRIDGIK